MDLNATLFHLIDSQYGHWLLQLPAGNLVFLHGRPEYARY
jgi:hypothetical protein